MNHALAVQHKPLAVWALYGTVQPNMTSLLLNTYKRFVLFEEMDHLKHVLLCCCLLELSRLSEIQQRAPLIQLAAQPIGATCCGVGVFHCFTTHKGYFYDRLFAIFREKWLIVCISYAQRSRGWTHGAPTRPSISWTFIAVTSKPSNWSCSAAKRWANVGRQPLRHHHHLATCHVAIKTHPKIFEFL